MEAIFENYELFIKEHADEINTPMGAVKMINDEGMFRAYMDSLTEGLDSDVRTTVMNVLSREREMILQEAANVGASSVTSGWTVMSFPILVDIYSEPIIAELCNVYPVDKPMISIPRVRIKAQTKSYDGSTVTEEYIPTAISLIRANVMTVNAVPNAATNVFTATSLSPENMKMNRRYTLLTQIAMTETDAGSTTHEHIIDVNFRPDARAQISRDFTFMDSTGVAVTGKINAHIDYEKGDVTFSVIFGGGDPGASFVCDYAVMTLRFTPVATISYCGLWH